MSSEWLEFLKNDFVQGFPAFCGFEVIHAGYGKFDTRLKVLDEHQQQDGFVHAGVIATMADHTSGYASFTTVTRKFRILTVEFKINYFKPATGPNIICRSKVVSLIKLAIKGRNVYYSQLPITLPFPPFSLDSLCVPLN